MQYAYIDTLACIEHAICNPSADLFASPVRIPLPVTPSDLSRYIEKRLIAEELRLCEMETN